MFFPTSIISLMMPFRTFSFLDFQADLLQKSISVASNLFACCVFSVPYSKILWTKAWYINCLVLWRIVLLHKTEFNMLCLTLLPSLILFSISKVFVPVYYLITLF
jgi:hypothetical protein